MTQRVRGVLAPVVTPLKLVRFPTFTRAYPRRFTLITHTAPVLAPATLAALPSTRAIPDRDVFYVARISRSNSINRAEGNRLKDGQCPNESRHEAQISKARTESFAFFLFNETR